MHLGVGMAKLHDLDLRREPAHVAPVQRSALRGRLRQHRPGAQQQSLADDVVDHAQAEGRARAMLKRSPSQCSGAPISSRSATRQSFRP
jgi:hypothetical protein